MKVELQGLEHVKLPMAESDAQKEGNLWPAVGVLTAAGGLKTVVMLLRKLRLPDRAAVYVEAASAAGFGSQSNASDTGLILLGHRCCMSSKRAHVQIVGLLLSSAKSSHKAISTH